MGDALQVVDRHPFVDRVLAPGAGAVRDRRDAPQAAKTVAVVYERLRTDRQPASGDRLISALEGRHQQVFLRQLKGVADEAELQADRRARFHTQIVVQAAKLMLDARPTRTS